MNECYLCAEVFRTIRELNKNIENYHKVKREALREYETGNTKYERKENREEENNKA